MLTVNVDVAGFVAKVGPGVTAVKPGDRVLGYAGAFLTGNNKHGAFQTYSTVSEFAVTKIPDALGFKEASTIPQGVGTAVTILFDSLSLPLPTGAGYSRATASLAPYIILIWGASSSVGFFTAQIARMVGLTVYGVASETHHAKLRSTGASEVFDYHSPTVVEDIVAAAKRAGKTISYAVDSISVAETIAPVMKVLAQGPPRTRKLAYTALWPQDEPQINGINTVHPSGEDILDRRVDLCSWLFNSALPKWLEEGAVEPLRHQAVGGGISGVQDAMNRLKEGVHMEKLLVEL